jgi:hypothetical protein
MSTSTPSHRVVNAAMLEFELWSVKHGYAANKMELQCMDECVRDMNARQALYSVGAGAAVFCATHVIKLPTPFPGPRMRLPIGARLIASCGAAFFASDVACLHASRNFLQRLIALPSSPLGERMRVKFHLGADAREGAQLAAEPKSTLRTRRTRSCSRSGGTAGDQWGTATPFSGTCAHSVHE